VLIVFVVNCAALADRLLERAETLQVFQELTAQLRKTWIPAGTIEAIHEEFRAPKTKTAEEIRKRINEKIAEYQSKSNKKELTENLKKMKLDAIPFNVRHELSNEYKMNSNVIVRFDGERFYWEINVNSRQDSITPSEDLVDNFMTEEFNLDWNARRIFAWDGENYTTYFLPGNHATIDSTGQTPHVVNGPLTAGVIAWGYGYYSYENLAAVDSTAIEKYVDGQFQIYLSLKNRDGSQISFVLDPTKKYAVISCVITGRKNADISKQYTDYRLVSGKWVPTTILLEEYEPGTKNLLAQDLWEFTHIDGDVPAVHNFSVDYEDDALIEYSSLITDKPAMYRHSELIDTEQLLAERLAFASNEETQQNCATAALKYTVSKLGKDVTDRQLARLVTEAGNQTNLLAMKQFVQRMGLYCRVVTTDIDTLKDLEDCGIILHIPGKRHFVILESVDENYVRIIDLTKNKFYYRTDINFFEMDWTEGTALIISNKPIEGKLTEIDDIQLDGIIGASGYSCTRRLQKYNVIFCTKIDEQCEGYYRVYYERWGCEYATSGSCSMSVMPRFRKCLCVESLEYPFDCKGNGNWTTYYMRACY
jgi:hypothetical protein